MPKATIVARWLGKLQRASACGTPPQRRHARREADSRRDLIKTFVHISRRTAAREAMYLLGRRHTHYSSYKNKQHTKNPKKTRSFDLLVGWSSWSYPLAP